LSNLTKIHIEKKGLETILSTLESDIMNILWKRNPLKVKELHELLKKKHKVAQTSIAVTMDRLYEKKIVDRKIESGRGGLHYLYYPSKTKQEFEKTIVDTTVNKLIEAFGPTAVSYFDERFKKGVSSRSKSKRKD
jgi:predicted transcriptional regulator